MRRINARQLPALAALVCVAAMLLLTAGCKSRTTETTGEPDAGAVLKELDSFTSELVGKVEAARDPVNGLIDAQALLDARKAEFSLKIAAVKHGQKFAQDNELRRRALESEIDNVMRVQGLRTKHLEEASNAAFRERLDKLINDYQDLFKS